jgi:hypothetical protein
MSDDFQHLKERLVKQSDEELLEIVLAAPGEYRQEAIDIAKAELKWRRVEIPEPEEPDDESPSVAYDPSAPARIAEARHASASKVCSFCGGTLRSGTLVGEKELTIVFSDNREERFITVNACTNCGYVSLAVDFETEVQ